MQSVTKVIMLLSVLIPSWVFAVSYNELGDHTDNLSTVADPKILVGIETLRSVSIQVHAGEDNLILEDISVNKGSCTMSSIVKVDDVKKILPVMLNEEDVAVIQVLSDCEVLMLDITINGEELKYAVN